MRSFAGVYDVLCSSCCSRIKMACFYSRMKIDRLNALPYNTIVVCGPVPCDEGTVKVIQIKHKRRLEFSIICLL
jgi:hypothetical protein